MNHASFPLFLFTYFFFLFMFCLPIGLDVLHVWYPCVRICLTKCSSPISRASTHICSLISEFHLFSFSFSFFFVRSFWVYSLLQITKINIWQLFLLSSHSPNYYCLLLILFSSVLLWFICLCFLLFVIIVLCF